MKIIVITSPVPDSEETAVCNTLFAHGLEILHLRKPGFGAEIYERFILGILPRYRNRIVIHDHYPLAGKHRLRGIHLKSGQANLYQQLPHTGSVSISCHSPEEIRELPFRPDYCFLSPVFDSISKPSYRSAFPQLPDLSGIEIPVIALGGITPERIDNCREAGFAGAAVLGYLWEKKEEALPRFTRLQRPFVLSIAGFDPSSGAGITADLKTFEATGSYGLGACTALTFQHEERYTGNRWTSPEDLRRQCDLLFSRHRPAYLKIGLIESFEQLDRLTAYLITACPGVKIIWDPICKASAGFVFHTARFETSESVLKRIYLITPNSEEITRLFGNGVSVAELQTICRKCQVNILWKGGHDSGTYSADRLITPESVHIFQVIRSPYTKHGTGCVLSAAITSFLAQGYSLPQACNKAQLYVASFIDSNDSLLGYHTMTNSIPELRPAPEELNLQYITAPKSGMSLAEQVEAVCRGGVRWVQLRMKGATFAELIREGKIIREICNRYRTLFIVNDNAEAARQLNADGVHLGKEDMDPREARALLGPGKIIGATCNTWEDILLRQRQQVDYIGLGPFAFTTTKEKLSPVLGLQGYRTLLRQMQQQHIRIPVFAIGGITEKDIPGLFRTGIQGIALSGLIKNSENLCTQTAEIIRLIHNCKHQ